MRDAFNYFAETSEWQAQVCFSKDTNWFPKSPNLWTDLKNEGITKLDPEPGDLLFLSGRDWEALPAEWQRQPPVPILNIAQPRHVRDSDGRQQFLANPAIRIAKSQHGADILKDFGVNGPLVTIPDAIDLEGLPPVPKMKDIDILVIGLKQPAFGQQVYDRLKAWNEAEGLGLSIHLQLPPKLPTREDFLSLLSRAKIVACIPLEAARGGEGFYLPALEAMALETLVVCPHATGNLGHCRDGENCIVPDFTVDGLVEGVRRMFGCGDVQKSAFLTAGKKTARAHDRKEEKAALLDLAARAYDMWSAYDFSLPLPPEKTPNKRKPWWRIFKG